MYNVNKENNFKEMNNQKGSLGDGDAEEDLE